MMAMQKELVWEDSLGCEERQATCSPVEKCASSVVKGSTKTTQSSCAVVWLSVSGLFGMFRNLGLILNTKVEKTLLFFPVK